MAGDQCVHPGGVLGPAASMFKLLSQVRVDAAQFVIYVVVSRVSKSMSYATEGVKPDVRELGVRGLCNRKPRLVVALLGFFG